MKTINALLIGISVVLIAFALGESIGRLGDLQLAKMNPEIFEVGSHDLHYAKNSTILYVHVIAGMLFLLTGSYQLIPYFRNRNWRIHRSIGKVFLTISFVLASSAIAIALFIPYGNWVETFVNIVFGSFILFATIRAYVSIRKKNVLAHSYWVRRIFFISLSIATVRVFMITIILLTGLSLQKVMGISFLLGFTLHLIVVEWWIKKDKQRRVTGVT